MSSSRNEVRQLSVVIPAFNSAPWLPSTLAALAVALRGAHIDAETIVVDDGSSDETAAVARAAAHDFPGSLSVLSQPNQGRFAARWAGLQSAQGEFVLLLDSRVIIHPTALRYAFTRIAEDSAARAWNAHIETDPRANLTGLFWDVPTYIFWGDYLRRPRPYTLTPANFDSAPKGTTMFLADRRLLVSAFMSADIDREQKLVSDDTAVLRALVTETDIRLDPGFAATYRPRTTVGSFMAHSFGRGTLFVDSYAGTSAVRSAAILAAVAAPIVILLAFVVTILKGWLLAAALTACLCVGLAVCPVLPAALNRCPSRSIAAYIIVLPIFVAPFWAGLARGIVLHRRAFRRRPERATQRNNA